MKSTNFKTFLFISLLFVTSVASAQSGAIYNFDFDIDPILIDFKSTEVLGVGHSNREKMPEQLQDSIKIKTVEAFANKLQIPVKMCFHTFKSEKMNSFVNSMDTEIIRGLPFNNFRMAKKDCPNNSRYINLWVDIMASESTSSFDPFTTKTKSKPYIDMRVIVFDENKNEVWKNKIRIKDFEMLRSKTKHYGIFDATKSETLSPLDIYEMYLMGLDMLMQE